QRHINILPLPDIELSTRLHREFQLSLRTRHHHPENQYSQHWTRRNHSHHSRHGPKPRQRNSHQPEPQRPPNLVQLRSNSTDFSQWSPDLPSLDTSSGQQPTAELYSHYSK